MVAPFIMYCMLMRLNDITRRDDTLDAWLGIE